MAVVMVGCASLRNPSWDVVTSILYQDAWDGKCAQVRPLILASNLSPLHFARETLVRKALSVPQITHMLFVDDDVRMRYDVLRKLLDADKPIVAAWYPMRHRFQMSDGAARYKEAYGMFKGSVKTESQGEVASLKSADISPEAIDAGKRLFKVDWVGMGCTLIRRDALEAIPADGFFLPPHEAESMGVASAGEDIMYCISAAKKGVPIYAHIEAAAGHKIECELDPAMLFHGNAVWNPYELQTKTYTDFLLEAGGLPDGKRCIILDVAKFDYLQFVTDWKEAKKEAKA